MGVLLADGRKANRNNGLRSIAPDPAHTIPTPAVLAGPTGTISRADLVEAVQNCPDLTPDVKAEVLRLIRQPLASTHLETT
jgi:hypothetical protein